MPYKLFLIDDHKVVRDGVKAMLLAKPDIRVVGEAASAKEAKEKITTLQQIRTELYLILKNIK